jgi:hypothetical protein
VQVTNETHTVTFAHLQRQITNCCLNHVVVMIVVERSLGEQRELLFAVVVEELHCVAIQFQCQRFQERDVSSQQFVVARAAKVKLVRNQLVDSIVRQDEVCCSELSNSRPRQPPPQLLTQ